MTSTGQRPTSPAHRPVTFQDGNSRPALDPHDGRSLRIARGKDPVVLSDDPTLGQTVPLGFVEVPVVAFSGVCAGVAVGTVALATGAVHNGFLRFVLVVAALACGVPAVRILVYRFWHGEGAIAIGHAGLTVHRHGKELHLAWVEIKRIKVATTTYHRPVRQSGVLSGRVKKVQARTEIRLAPAVPEGFQTHISSRLLHPIWRRSGTMPVGRTTYTHTVPLRHRLLIADDHVPEPVLLADMALRRFAGDQYAGHKATRRRWPFLW